MRVYRWEVRKLLRFPAVFVLMAAFLVFNGFLVWQMVGTRWIAPDLKRMHEIILQRGVKLWDRTVGAAAEAPRPGEAGELEAFYDSYVETFRHKYDSLDMHEMQALKEKLTGFCATGKYREFIDRNYDRWQKRVEEIRETDEGMYAFYPGNAFQIHQKLYGELFSALLIEGMVLVSFCVLYLMDLDRIHSTDSLVYTSREGRGILLRKFLAGLLTGVVFDLLLIMAALVLFFCFVPMKGLWNVPISSVLYYENTVLTDYPFITVVPLTFAEYLAAAVILAVLLAALLGALCGAIQFFVKSSYFSALIQALLFLGMLAIVFVYDRDSFLRTLLAMNPAVLWYLRARWLIESNLMLSFGGWEILTLILWGVIALTGIFFGNRYFRSTDY